MAPKTASEAKIENGSRRLEVLGIYIDALSLNEAVALVETWVAEGRRTFAIFRDVHGLMLCQRDASLRAAHLSAGMVATDGMPLAFLARRAFGADVGRVYGPDFMDLFCRSTTPRGYRHFLFGSAPETVARLREALIMRAPGLNIVGTLSPPFRPLSDLENKQIVTAINEARPDIVWVGLGTPKQELWMMGNVGKIEAAAMLGVGAAFDFLSGTKPQAPRWIRQSGFEWAYRLASEPRRLAKRYFTCLPSFIATIAMQRAFSAIRCIGKPHQT